MQPDAQRGRASARISSGAGHLSRPVRDQDVRRPPPLQQFGKLREKPHRRVRWPPTRIHMWSGTHALYLAIFGLPATQSADWNLRRFRVSNNYQGPKQSFFRKHFPSRHQSLLGPWGYGARLPLIPTGSSKNQLRAGGPLRGWVPKT